MKTDLRLDEAVVHTVRVNVLDPPLSHILHDIGCDNSLVDSTISIWSDCNPILALQQNLAVIRDTWQNTLFEIKTFSFSILK